MYKKNNIFVIMFIFLLLMYFLKIILQYIDTSKLKKCFSASRMVVLTKPNVLYFLILFLNFPFLVRMTLQLFPSFISETFM